MPFFLKGSRPCNCTVLPCTKMYHLKARAVIYFLIEKKAELAALLVYVEG